MTSRAVLVTGASRGIGRAVARAFAAGGDRVAIHHRDSAELAEQLRDELPGDGHVVVRADLADPDAVRAMVDEAAERLGGLDVLVNNAGVYGPRTCRTRSSATPMSSGASSGGWCWRPT
ncbi:SDR family NAD(P)-dependent oxidoreductase [Micromonospora sicca]|uniref:SDR family NAD(P)-dependent oxidoreductase n=1 Tax=Micromonospora sicca TaxID=2202420 RepID=UPI0021063E64|nr:SDR family NAD(P)-dependent oxidoreductase [Micromonospora sp. 4G51]